MPFAFPPWLGDGDCHWEGPALPSQVSGLWVPGRPTQRLPESKAWSPLAPSKKKKKSENNLILGNAALIISPSNKICLQT